VLFQKAPEGGYIATVPVLPGCLTQGETFEETEANIKDAIRAYLEVLKEDGDEIDLGSLRLVEDLKKVSQKTLVEGIIRPRLNELFTMVALELKKSGLFTQTPAGIVITGGGARTVGAEDSAKRMLAMPVRVGVPTGISGLIDEVENPSFASAIGLLMYGKNFRTKDTGGMFSNMLGSISMRSTGGSGIVGKIKKLIKNFIP